MTPEEQYLALIEWSANGEYERMEWPPLTLDLCAEWEDMLCEVPGIYDAAHPRYKYAANLYRIVPPERQPIRATKEHRMEALCRTLWPERFK